MILLLILEHLHQLNELRMNLFFSLTPQCSSCMAKHHTISLGMTSWCEKQLLFACSTSLEAPFPNGVTKLSRTFLQQGKKMQD